MTELVRDTQIRIGVEGSRPLIIDVGGTPDEVFSVLANEQRRQALAVLRDASAPMGLSTLVERVADRLDSEPPESTSREAPCRLRVSLHHHHLPKMASTGFVEYDAENNIVKPTDAIQA